MKLIINDMVKGSLCKRAAFCIGQRDKMYNKVLGIIRKCTNYIKVLDEEKFNMYDKRIRKLFRKNISFQKGGEK